MQCFLKTNNSEECLNLTFVVPTVNQEKIFAQGVPKQECTGTNSTTTTTSETTISSSETVSSDNLSSENLTNTPTRNVVADKEEALRDCNAVSAGVGISPTKAYVFFWHYGTVQPEFKYLKKGTSKWLSMNTVSQAIESFPNWWHSASWIAGNFNYDIAVMVNGIKVKTYNEPAIKPPLPTSAEEVDKLCKN